MLAPLNWPSQVWELLAIFLVTLFFGALLGRGMNR